MKRMGATGRTRIVPQPKSRQEARDALNFARAFVLVNGRMPRYAELQHAVPDVGFANMFHVPSFDEVVDLLVSIRVGSNEKLSLRHWIDYAVLWRYETRREFRSAVARRLREGLRERKRNQTGVGL